MRCASASVSSISSAFDRGFLGFRETVLRLMHAVDHLHVVAVSQARISRSVVRIRIDRLLKVVDALLQSFGRALVPGVAALQVKPVSLQLLLLFDVQLQTQVFKDVARDFFLNEKNVSEPAIVMLAPNLRDTIEVNQVSLDADGVAMTMDAAGDDCAHIQFLAHLARINVAAFVANHHAARNHAQFWKFGQAVDQAFGNLVVKVFRICIRTVVDKRQDCD